MARIPPVQALPNVAEGAELFRCEAVRPSEPPQARTNRETALHLKGEATDATGGPTGDDTLEHGGQAEEAVGQLAENAWAMTGRVEDVLGRNDAARSL